MSLKIGILREEGRNPPDKRTPLTPNDCQNLISTYNNVQVVVQPSTTRCFTDQEYLLHKISLQEDLADCDILLGIKEVPIELLMANKTYLFFSHTLKKQVHNRKLLQTILQKKIRLIDYECIVDDKGNRLIAFGFFAGVIGAYNGIKTYGNRFNLFELKPAYLCHNLNELEREFSKVKLPAIKVIVTGGGRVANGAIEVLNKMGIKQVTPSDFIAEDYDRAVYTQLNSSDYNKQLNSNLFDRDDFHHNPQNYVSTFLPYAHQADLLIAGAFWHPLAPKLFTKEDMIHPDFAIQIVADITCDIGGSIPCTVKASTINDPIYDYDPNNGTIHPPFSDKSHITVMAVDNLPCELPRDASAYFGERMITNVMPHLLNNTTDKIVSRATITYEGKLTPRFSYLQDFVDG